MTSRWSLVKISCIFYSFLFKTLSSSNSPVWWLIALNVALVALDSPSILVISFSNAAKSLAVGKLSTLISIFVSRSSFFSMLSCRLNMSLFLAYLLSIFSQNSVPITPNTVAIMLQFFWINIIISIIFDCLRGPVGNKYNAPQVGRRAGVVSVSVSRTRNNRARIKRFAQSHHPITPFLSAARVVIQATARFVRSLGLMRHSCLLLSSVHSWRYVVLCAKI
ncbi:hypothetical protein HD_0119 [[Haemophilus] ducreyi 35000HP]|uniref:Uncharacterized protein n=1 Tax=Haemophilus ducreyi (strain 35000HP / ATCC 700724) TaxID=233412 RepID=Q7VPG2_HAEDU|nr:hypothetical protein HD_0119 [[Haemophilus] ducreyi 35000HP]